MARYRIHHKTTCTYDYSVIASHHSTRLKPLTNDVQNCERFLLNISPASQDILERTDYFSNTMHLFSIQESHDKLTVESESIVTTNRIHPPIEKISMTCGEVRTALADITRTDLIDGKLFLYPTETTPVTPEITAFGQRFFQDNVPVGQALLDLLNCFKTEFTYDSTATELNTPITEVIEHKRGVCQDFAHLMIATLRSAGLSCRYASGYILTHPPEGMPRLIGADASHAWVSAYIPGIEWVDMDPTNNSLCADQHICVGYGRDYSDVGMLNGAVTGGGKHHLSVEVTMAPIEE